MVIFLTKLVVLIDLLRLPDDSSLMIISFHNHIFIILSDWNYNIGSLPCFRDDRLVSYLDNEETDRDLNLKCQLIVTHSPIFFNFQHPETNQDSFIFMPLRSTLSLSSRFLFLLVLSLSVFVNWNSVQGKRSLVFDFDFDLLECP